MRLKILISVNSFLLAVLAFGTFGSSSMAAAASLNYTSYPMNDSTFRASFTMTADDIQNFLVTHGSALANFSDVENCGSPSGAHYSFYASYYTCGASVKASKIIYDSARAYGINPQVILATLQKEQSLITAPNPVAAQFNYAMGYGCPDSSGCAGYAGFFNQIDNGTWQFRTDYELASGNSYWGYSPSSFPCNGPTRYYNKALLPGNDVTFIDENGAGYTHFVIPNASTATLYCYTPHVFPGSTQQYYSGSYWFVYYFSQWFGSNVAPFAFKSPSFGTVYLYVNGYKISVPSMAMLQDYGVSPAAIQTLSQATVDAIPTPSLSLDGVSPSLSYIVKSPSDSDSDGGAVYLISVGRKNAVSSMQQFNDFGFSTANISYLPLSFINSIYGNQPLSNYIGTPTSNAFQVSNGQKRIIFDTPTYSSLNPSGASTQLSGYLAGTIPSGIPLSNREILVQLKDSATLYLLSNNLYYPLSSIDLYNCWGFGQTLKTPLYQIAENSYIASIVPTASLGNCVVTDGNITYLLNGSNKFAIPSTYGNFTSQVLSPDLVALSAKLPTSTAPLKQAVKSSDSAAIWYIENGNREIIPSISNLKLLGLDLNTNVDIINSFSVKALPALGIKLGIGQIVKSESGPAVYASSSNGRFMYPSSETFLAYGNSWSDIETYAQTTLDQAYPTNSQIISQYLFNVNTGNLYLVDSNGCYSLSSGMQTSFGINQTSLASTQTYSSALFPKLNLSNCRNASTFVKQPGSPVVYWVDAGLKHPAQSWVSLVQKSGTSSPDIIYLSQQNIESIPTGSPL